MALETLKGMTEIDGFKVRRMGNRHPENAYIEIDDKLNAITFKIQNGPIIENGVNGCQVDTLIATAKHIIQGLNDKFPCNENTFALHHLDTALIYLKDRKKDRERRRVEGISAKCF